MKRIILLTALFLQFALSDTIAQGWPSGYSGVMLQSFIWDDYETSSWDNLTNRCDELSKYFDLIWIPQSGSCGGGTNMGYSPVYWLTHNSSFGTQRKLRAMIQTYKEKGTGFIADVVINHKNGKSGWIDFANETANYEGKTWTINWWKDSEDECLKYICSNDECSYNGYKATGAADTGENFDGCRDLDHTNATVQENIKTYLDFLINNLGYTGFRYDMVKGFNGKYVGIYNASAKPEFSVGENWDGYSTITSWMNATKVDGKIQSAAFDFPLKYQLNKAFGSGQYSELNSRGVVGDVNYSRYCVTFVDNHDTGRDASKLTCNWSAANAFILASPGTPCIWIKHYEADPDNIQKMILARKAAGLTNDGTQVIKAETSNGGYIYQTRGSKGDVYVQCGNAVNNGTPSGFKLIAKGDAYRFFCSSNLNIDGIDDAPDPTHDITIYVRSTSSTVPYLYAWDNNLVPLCGEWPGTKLSQIKRIDGGNYYYHTLSNVSNINIIFNNGSGKQTADINGITEDAYFNWDGASGYENVTQTLSVEPVFTEPTTSTPLYNLAGQRVDKDYRGIVIRNGKKYLKR